MSYTAGSTRTQGGRARGAHATRGTQRELQDPIPPHRSRPSSWLWPRARARMYGLTTVMRWDTCLGLSVCRGRRDAPSGPVPGQILGLFLALPEGHSMPPRRGNGPREGPEKARFGPPGSSQREPQEAEKRPFLGPPGGPFPRLGGIELPPGGLRNRSISGLVIAYPPR